MAKWDCPDQKHLFVGNGMCDDISNIAECGWDNFECCHGVVQYGKCSECICHSSGQRQFDILKGISWYL